MLSQEGRREAVTSEGGYVTYPGGSMFAHRADGSLDAHSVPTEGSESYICAGQRLFQAVSHPLIGTTTVVTLSA